MTEKHLCVVRIKSSSFECLSEGTHFYLDLELCYSFTHIHWYVAEASSESDPEPGASRSTMHNDKYTKGSFNQLWK